MPLLSNKVKLTPQGKIKESDTPSQILAWTAWKPFSSSLAGRARSLNTLLRGCYKMQKTVNTKQVKILSALRDRGLNVWDRRVQLTRTRDLTPLVNEKLLSRQCLPQCHVFLRTGAYITQKFEIISNNYLKLTVVFWWKTFRGGSDKQWAYL